MSSNRRGGGGGGRRPAPSQRGGAAPRGGGGGGRGSFTGGSQASGSTWPFAPAPVAAQTPAPVAPTPTPAPVAPPPATSSAVPASHALVSQELASKLTLGDTSRPESSKSWRPPQRPNFGTAGKKCMVKANHFMVQVADRDMHHYDVAITPEITSKRVNRDVMAQLTKMYGETHLGKRIPAYDGRKSLYTAGALPFESRDFVVELDKDLRDGSGSSSGSSSNPRKERKFKVAIKLASKPDLHTLRLFLNDRYRDCPQEVIQVLDVVLRATPYSKYVDVGRSFYSPHLGERGRGELGSGIEFWRGFYQSLRPTQMGLSFNTDTSARGFYEPILVTEFIQKHTNIRSLLNPLLDHDRVKVKKALKGLKVQVSHVNYVRSYKITGISSQPLSELTFTLDDKVTRKFVIQYYREKYNIALKYPALPALQAGSESRPVYLPMELCKIVEGQRFAKKLNETQVAALLRETCQRPFERENNIKKMVLANSYSQDRVTAEFGIRVQENLTMCEARVLPSPQLNYHETGREARVYPTLGQWNMINKRMINGGRVDYWACVCFSTYTKRDQLLQFCSQLSSMCSSKGMVFNPNPVIPPTFSNANQIERALADVHHRVTAEIARKGRADQQLQLLLVILPDANGHYGRIKRACEIDLGIVSQCCKPKHVTRVNPQYLENVSLKINVKVGGSNTVLNDAIMRRIPLVSEHPTIIFGADVTHPQPGEDSSPSIAAVVASMDWPQVTTYRGIVSAQSHRVEIIKDLYTRNEDAEKGVVHGGMIRELLRAFKISCGQKPLRIIFYRDGVSEGQFGSVLMNEVIAIRKACASLEDNYQPPITFVVVQKRHHTRLFPADHGNRQWTDKSGNILPGTVVDTSICHPTEFDFYLNSHAGIKGTSRPTHYHVLHDENGFKADQLQILTNNLCYTYARCTRAVSIVPPAYYAHLLAFRARYYIEGEYSDAGSSSGTRASKENAPEKKPMMLPSIKENVKTVMFYC